MGLTNLFGAAAVAFGLGGPDDNAPRERTIVENPSGGDYQVAEDDNGLGGTVVRKTWDFLKGAGNEFGEIWTEETKNYTTEDFANDTDAGGQAGLDKAGRFLDQLMRNRGYEEGLTVENSVDGAEAVFAWGGEKGLRALNRFLENRGMQTIDPHSFDSILNGSEDCVGLTRCRSIEMEPPG